MTLKNLAKPTKKYIAGLLKSENIIPEPEAIEQCLFGWLHAVGTPRAEREARTRAINEGVFWGGDCEGIGYCSATYLLMLKPKAPKVIRPSVEVVDAKQLRMEI